MTIRLFDADPYRLSCPARLLSCRPAKGGFAAVLDQTVFFPRGGGQPCDVGNIDGVPVSDVYDEGGEILHILPRELSPGPVCVAIDGQTRLRHMQYHLGQHILSAVIDKTFGVPTSIARIEAAGPHIELPRPLDMAELVSAQELAREVIARDLPVSSRYYTPEEALQIPVRGKITPHERIRLVTIEGFDRNACGGTHCSSTGGVCDLLVTGTKEVRGAFRIYYAAGGDASAARQSRSIVLLQMQQSLSCESLAQLEQAHAALLERKDALESQNHALREALLQSDAALWAARCHPIQMGRFCCALLDGGDVKHLRQVAEALCSEQPTALLFAVRQNAQLALLFMRSKAKEGPDLGRAVQALCSRFGGRGGGSPILAQGMAPDSPECEAAVQALFDDLACQLDGRSPT